MELQELRDLCMNHGTHLSTLDEWAKGVELRVQNIERSQSVLLEVQIGLKELAMSNRFMGDKLDELKHLLDKIVDDNIKQHDDLKKRIDNIEQKPATKWENAKWLIIAATLTGLVGYLISKIGIL